MPIVGEKIQSATQEDLNLLDNKLNELDRRFGYHNHDGSNSQKVAISNLRGPVILGGILQSITPQDDIQTAINYVNANGGGTVFLKNGTYSPGKSLTMYSNIIIQGQSGASTIIDFGSGAYSFSMVGSSVYSAGSIASISGGVNVVGSNTNWTGSMVQQQIFINNRWYVISSILGATSMTLASGYADGATFTGTYRISSVIKNCAFKDFTVQKSTATVFSGTDVRDILFEDIIDQSNNIGLALTNFYQISTNRVLIASSTLDGVQLTNGAFFNAYSTASVSSGGNNWTLNNIKSCTFIFSAGDSATGGDGMNCTSVTNSAFKMECSSNSGKGINFVSGCNGNLIDDELINANTSDGIKFAATSSNNTIIACDITNNGGWGINIAASSCSNNIINEPYFANNTSGTYTNSGTATIILDQSLSATDTVRFTKLGLGNAAQSNNALRAVGIVGGYAARCETDAGSGNNNIFQVLNDGDIVAGTTALATNANTGFLFIPSMAGAPTGTPATQEGTKAIVYDTSTNKLWVYNGAWKGVALL